MRVSHRIVFASLNVDKYREFKAILAAYPDLDLIPAEGIVRNVEKLAFVETHPTYLENAAAKARLANMACHYPILADDTGLEVDSLDGRPGVRTQRYAQAPQGSAPLSRMEQDKANLELLMNEIRSRPNASRSARFVTTVTLMIEGILIHATGTLEGTIADSPRGAHGFGYDPVFVPKGSNKTLAEMSDSEKNSLSHRSKAIHELMTQVKARGIVFAKP
jgi:XTP/dITP diphosphohydrolase